MHHTRIIPVAQMHQAWFKLIGSDTNSGHQATTLWGQSGDGTDPCPGCQGLCSSAFQHVSTMPKTRRHLSARPIENHHSLGKWKTLWQAQWAVRLSGTGLACPCVHEAPAHSITLVAFDKIIQTIKALQANSINLIASCTAFACRYVGHAGFWWFLQVHQFRQHT